MCATNPGQHCERPQPLAVADLLRVHLAVQQAIAPLPDDPGQAFDTWAIWPAAGDCSAQVATRRATLLALGVDPAAITIVLGEHKRAGQWRKHMRLEVQLAGEVWVMDSVSPRSLFRPGGEGEPFPWREIAREPRTGVQWEAAAAG